MELIVPADKFVVINKTILNDNDRKLLIMLYQPLIGSIAINLYLTLWSYLDKNEIVSNDWNHGQLSSSMKLNIEALNEAREKLEAIGLLKTYVRKSEINDYIYELYSPLNVYDFFTNPILTTTLYNQVGKDEYQKIVDYFKIPKISLNGYEDITSRFTDVFEITNQNPSSHIVEDVKKANSRSLSFVSKIDLNNILSRIPSELLNSKSITKEIKEFIYKLGLVYNFNDDEMIELIRNSLTDKLTIDKNALRKNARSYYNFENSGKLPNLVYRNQPEYLRKAEGDTSKKARMIYTFEVTTPYDYLVSKTKCELTKGDKAILELLLIDFELMPGVVNVLIDYVLKINNNKLTKAYVEAIANQWKRSKIETVEEAMKIAETEYKKTKPKTAKVVSKPEWFDKENKKETLSVEEQKELNEMMKKYKGD